MKFSVAMCVWAGDEPGKFEMSIQSCLQQSYLPDQIVLIVDGPITKALEIVIDNVSSKINLMAIDFDIFRFDQNVGHGIARRKSIDLCCNELIAICDADDLNLPFRFEMQHAFLKSHSEISVVGGHIREIVDDSELIQLKKVPTSSYNITKYLKFRCPMNQMTVMFRKKDIIEVGGYKDFYHNEDYYLWCRLIVAGKKLSNLDTILVEATVNNSSYKRRGGINYFKSEVDIQIFMLNNGLTNVFFVLYNILVRVFFQLLVPFRVRKFLFRKLFRG